MHRLSLLSFLEDISWVWYSHGVFLLIPFAAASWLPPEVLGRLRWELPASPLVAAFGLPECSCHSFWPQLYPPRWLAVGCFLCSSVLFSCLCSDFCVSVTTSPDRSISDGLLGGSRFQEQALCPLPRVTVNEERNKCLFLQKLQGQLRFLYFLKVKEFVAQSCLTPRTVAHQGSSMRGILQARILEWAAISFSRGSSRQRDWTWVSWIAGRLFTMWAILTLVNSKQQQKTTFSIPKARCYSQCSPQQACDKSVWGKYWSWEVRGFFSKGSCLVSSLTRTQEQWKEGRDPSALKPGKTRAVYMAGRLCMFGENCILDVILNQHVKTSYAIYGYVIIYFIQLGELVLIVSLLLFNRSVVSDSATPWTAESQASLSFIISQSLFKLMSIKSVMPSIHLILIPSPPAFNLSQHQSFS